tara:strand:+ start:377 stop:631 length:255 start_codon:yes stop_codon:yes gene_type:complete
MSLATFGQLFAKSKSVRKLKIKISDGKEYDVVKEGLSFKKIFKSAQNQAPKDTKALRVVYANRKGTLIDRWQKVPLGRGKKFGK